MFSCRSVLCLLLLAGAFAAAQESGAAGLDPMAGTGEIRNDLYTNTYYGFSFRFPTTWKVLLGPDSIAALGGCGKEQCRLLALQAQKGIGRVLIDARPVSAGSARDLLTKTAEQEQSMGFQPAGAIAETASGSLKLYRQDFRTEGAAGEILETLMATETKGSTILITILTDSRSTLDQLASALQPAGVAAAQQKESSR
jgi:hypothetical protein